MRMGDYSDPEYLDYLMAQSTAPAIITPDPMGVIMAQREAERQAQLAIDLKNPNSLASILKAQNTPVAVGSPEYIAMHQNAYNQVADIPISELTSSQATTRLYGMSQEELNNLSLQDLGTLYVKAGIAQQNSPGDASNYMAPEYNISDTAGNYGNYLAARQQQEQTRLLAAEDTANDHMSPFWEKAIPTALTSLASYIGGPIAGGVASAFMPSEDETPMHQKIIKGAAIGWAGGQIANGATGLVGDAVGGTSGGYGLGEAVNAGASNSDLASLGFSQGQILGSQAAISAAGSATLNAGTQAIVNGKVDPFAVLGAAATGAASSMATPATAALGDAMGGSTLANTAAGALTSTAINAGTQLLANGGDFNKINPVSLITSAVSGGYNGSKLTLDTDLPGSAGYNVTDDDSDNTGRTFEGEGGNRVTPEATEPWRGDITAALTADQIKAGIVTPTDKDGMTIINPNPNNTSVRLTLGNDATGDGTSSRFAEIRQQIWDGATYDDLVDEYGSSELSQQGYENSDDVDAMMQSKPPTGDTDDTNDVTDKTYDVDNTFGDPPSNGGKYVWVGNDDGNGYQQWIPNDAGTTSGLIGSVTTPTTGGTGGQDDTGGIINIGDTGGTGGTINIDDIGNTVTIADTDIGPTGTTGTQPDAGGTDTGTTGTTGTGIISSTPGTSTPVTSGPMWTVVSEDEDGSNQVYGWKYGNEDPFAILAGDTTGIKIGETGNTGGTITGTDIVDAGGTGGTINIGDTGDTGGTINIDDIGNTGGTINTGDSDFDNYGDDGGTVVTGEDYDKLVTPPPPPANEDEDEDEPPIIIDDNEPPVAPVIPDDPEKPPVTPDEPPPPPVSPGGVIVVTPGVIPKGDKPPGTGITTVTPVTPVTPANTVTSGLIGAVQATVRKRTADDPTGRYSNPFDLQNYTVG